MIELLPYLVGALVLLVWIRVERIGSQLFEIQRAIDQLRKELGVAPPFATEPSEEVRRLALEPGKTIEAIKRYREESGADLKAAKIMVEQLRRQAGDA